MATSAILRSDDSLFRPNHHQFRRNPNPSSCPRRRKRSPSATAKSPPKTLALGQVKILKRGEPLSPPSLSPATDLGLCSTDRLGPEPKTMKEQIGVYAGAAIFVASPPPSSLPVPAFCSMKEKNAAATCDIRRLLGLKMI